MKNLFTFLLALLAAGQFASAQPCTGGFNDSIDSLTVYFTNTATGSYNWIMYDYGDGVWDQYISNPTHVYAQAGVYEVCQFIQDTITFQCFDYTCDTLFIGGATCNADYWWEPDGLEVTYYSYSIGEYDSISWDFGDGTTSADTPAVHTYSNPGTYTVCLSLYTDTTLCDSTCYTVYVDSSSCDANFSSSTNGLQAIFTNQSNGNFNAVYWDFGDGFGSSEQFNPNYTYFTAGTYEVCLTVYDSIFGTCYDEYCANVTVSGGGGGGACQADFSYSTGELEIECLNTSSGNYLTAFFDYGDGTAPTLETTHVYDEPGTYEVCLTIANIFPFCADQYCQMVTVTELTCEAYFTYTVNESNVYSFSNETQGTFNSVLWEFGDGNTSTFANPSYSYNLTGVYEVCLYTYDNGNLCGIACREIAVYPVGIEKGLTMTQFEFYPNPNQGQITITANQSVEVELQVFDLRGRVLISDQVLIGPAGTPYTLELASGSYLMKLTDANGYSALERVVIQ